ncbi:hypothetical protein [Rhodanobacter spathiphylli]|uniref:Uncharacterized protein n=1 Tax=Rhodanobacter spathiphylli B39 TaxID=1163407 RepID=I4VV01_9GAMM|nr:hypothetical protein [Rhodanobacter spathiphylli]EIL91042.1 hypothetical protein UU7_14400 [Rhodanobacter spathiphylli B39]
MLCTLFIYSTGLQGGWLFDDYPNIVDNQGVHPVDNSIASLVRAALSSPASEFKRPLASLSFAANYLASGLDPYSWKLANVVIHLLNGALVFLLARVLLLAASEGSSPVCKGFPSIVRDDFRSPGEELSRTGCAPTSKRTGIVAAMIAGGWMLLPINLTGVLYVVQRMESMANLFVLLGLIGYVAGRRCMLVATTSTQTGPARGAGSGWGGFSLCLLSITLPTVLGLLAKETAVMLPLYALLVEWAIFRWRKAVPQTVGASRWVPEIPATPTTVGRAMPATPLQGDRDEEPAGSARPTLGESRKDWRVITLFLLVLALPLVIGLAWLLPDLLKPEAWATRDFTLGTRLLSEARIVTDYISWTLLPTPDALSFYHDDFRISTGLLAPWTTLASIVFLVSLMALLPWLHRRQPLAALGIALFLGCHLLTGTVLPLELTYEHRNYFASFGLLLAVVPLLAAPSRGIAPTDATDDDSSASESTDRLPMALPRYVLLAGLMLHWTALTAITAHAWGDPLRLAEELASRAPQSPRAQYELGRTYIIYSHYDPSSPFTQLAYAPLEASAALPHSSILPEQALIFMNARMGLPLKDAWWNSMIAKLKAHPPGVQDESSLGALTQCARDRHCTLPAQRMVSAFDAALAHPNPGSRLLATYGDYAWNVLDEHNLGERLTEHAVQATPDEPAYRITLVRMLVAQGRKQEARAALRGLEALNIGGRLDRELDELHALVDLP